jgi:hypothetical protein
MVDYAYATAYVWQIDIHRFIRRLVRELLLCLRLMCELRLHLRVAFLLPPCLAIDESHFDMATRIALSALHPESYVEGDLS